MIRARRLIPLAVQSDNPTLAAQGSNPAIEIPSVRRWVPNMPAPSRSLRHLVAEGREPVVQTMSTIWRDTIANSQRLKDYANSRAALFAPIYGQQAYDEAWKMVRQTAWLCSTAARRG